MSIQNNSKLIAVLTEKLFQLKEDLVEFIKRADLTFVTCKEFSSRVGLLEKIIFTTTGAILLAFLGVIIKDYIK